MIRAQSDLDKCLEGTVTLRLGEATETEMNDTEQKNGQLGEEA